MYLTPGEQRLIQAFKTAESQGQRPTLFFLAMVLNRSQATVYEYIHRLVKLGICRRGRSSYELCGDVCPTCGAQRIAQSQSQPDPAQG